MKIRKSQLLLLGGIFVCLAALIIIYPLFGVAAGDDGRKNDPHSKPANYDAFLESPERSAIDHSVSGRPGARELVKQYETRLGVPTFMFAESGRTNAGGKVSAADFAEAKLIERARAYVGEYAAEYRLTKSDLLSLEAVSVHDIGRGAIIVRFKQNVEGVEVFRDELNVVMNRQLELVALSGYLTGTGAANGAAAARLFQIEPEEAIARAVGDLTGRAVNTAFLDRREDLREEENVEPRNRYVVFEAGEYASEGVGFSSASPLRAKQVFYRLPAGLVPAYYVEANVEADPEDTKTPRELYYSYVVSAADGRVLARNDLTSEQAFTYRKWADPTSFIPFDGPQGPNASPHPTGNPDFYSPPYAAQNLITLQNYPFSQNDPWLPAGATETSGNNADAYADLSAPDGFNAGDLRANVTAPGVFDRSFNQGLPRTDGEQRQMAVTQLFYDVNFLHDWFYDSGFNEASGNAQFDNFGRGGLGNDRIRAEAQDYSGRNNANMNTPADGASPRMQMYLFDGVADSFLFVNAPAGIAGRKDVGAANGFGPQVFDVTADVAPALDPADGSGPTTFDGCSALTNAADVAGKIAIIDRGTCNFSVKVQNAQNAGAVGVIVADNLPGAVANMGGTAAGITIGSLRITQADGNAVRSALSGGSVTVRLFRGANPGDLDGTLDTQVVAHEWGHYISNRLIANSSGLVNQQGRGMGEGWGDFHALLLTVRPEDITIPGNNIWQGVYSMGGYATGHGPANSYYYGIRRIPYSSNLNKNALMFRHISDANALPTNAPLRPNGNPNSQVHNTGEVWATMLWECYVSLLNAYPFAEAQDRMKFYLVGGYKLTPPNPTFVEARNALLAVAAANDPADGQRLAHAFAKRGLGVRAVAPDRASTTNAGVVESTSTGGDLEFAGASLNAAASGDNDPYLDNGETATLNFSIRNSGFQSLFNSTATITSDNPNVTFPNGNTVSLPASQPFSAPINGSVNVAASGMTDIETATFTIAFNDPGITIGAPPAGTLTVRLNASELPNAVRFDNTETVQTVWTTAGDTVLDPSDAGRWRRIRPSGGVDQLWLGPDIGIPSDQSLISPAFIIDAGGNLTLAFDHSYQFETDAGLNYDGGVIEMSIDNGPWTDIGGSAYNGVIDGNYAGNLNPLVTRPAFVGSSGGVIRTTITTNALTAPFAPGSAVRVRFRIGSDNAGGAGGWRVDNFVVSGISNNPFPLLVPQGVVTAAGVRVEGRVRKANGAGLPNAVVTLTEPDGRVRSARTNPFGYYRFESLDAGESYTLAASAKGYRYAPRLVTPAEDVSGIDFIPLK
jgi:large repetitive protein